MTSTNRALTAAEQAGPVPGVEARRSPSGGTGDALIALALTLLGWLCVWGVLEAADLVGGPLTSSATTSGDLRPSVSGLLLAVGCGVAVSWVVWRLSGRGATPALLSTVSLLLAGTATAALHGSRWGLDGLYSDSGFRTEAVTRFADSPLLADYAYRGLPAYYPPLLPWLQGRAADLLGVPGWSVMKPTQILVCALVPVLSWLLWRRVLPPVTAAWVAGVVAVATAYPLKPDEWLVLALVVPWWLEVCRGLREQTVRASGVLRDGVILGLLLLTHTYFFLPLAIATVIGAVTDLLRRRTMTPAPRRAVPLALVGLLVAAPSWGPMVWLRVQGAASDNLQLRWSSLGFDMPPSPLPTDPRGVVELVGVVWLVAMARRNRVAEALLLVLVTAVGFMVLGQAGQPFGLAVLPEKSQELAEAAMAAGGALGLLHVAEELRRRTVSDGTRRAVRVVLSVVVALAAAQSLLRGVVDSAGPAQHVRYADGSFPAGGPEPESPRWHAWGVDPGTGGPSVAEVDDAWRELTGAGLDSSVMLVTARADVAALTPVHLFVTWKSIYSHPNGRFDERAALLGRAAQCPTPECLWTTLRTNELDAVDGLVLNRTADAWYLSVTADRFPEGWERQSIAFDPELFARPYFEVRTLGDAVVVSVAEER